MKCEQCGNRIRGEAYRTPLRVLCARCGDEFAGQAAGLIAYGTVEGAIATAGWYERIRSWRRGATKSS